VVSAGAIVPFVQDAAAHDNVDDDPNTACTANASAPTDVVEAERAQTEPDAASEFAFVDNCQPSDRTPELFCTVTVDVGATARFGVPVQLVVVSVLDP
jgi:hypothetical protein